MAPEAQACVWRVTDRHRDTTPRCRTPPLSSRRRTLAHGSAVQQCALQHGCVSMHCNTDSHAWCRRPFSAHGHDWIREREDATLIGRWSEQSGRPTVVVEEIVQRNERRPGRSDARVDCNGSHRIGTDDLVARRNHSLHLRDRRRCRRMGAPLAGARGPNKRVEQERQIL